jgi:hypothetical protein
MDDYAIVRTEEEIEKILDICSDAKQEGSTRYPGMDYEDGVAAAIRWLTDKDEEDIFD